MRTKHIAAGTVVVFAFAVALMAAEKQTPDSGPRLVLLKSGGATIAELKVLKGATLEIVNQSKTSQMTHDPKTGQVTATGGVTLTIKQPGSSSVTIKADEIEMVPNAK